MLLCSDSQLLGRTLGDLFSEEWVQQGDPHVLFIKRAARIGDRWSAHVALPGSYC